MVCYGLFSVDTSLILFKDSRQWIKKILERLLSHLDSGVLKKFLEWRMTVHHQFLNLCLKLEYLFGGLELWGVWLVDSVVIPMGLPTPSVPSVLSLAPPFGSPCSVR